METFDTENDNSDGVFHMEITIVGAILQYVKVVNLDFRRKKYRFKDDRSDHISIAFSCLMIFINICFVIDSGMNYHEDFDDYVGDDSLRKTHKMHGLLALASNASVSAITILLHIVIEEAKFNKVFLIHVARSYLIAVVQLPVQVVTLAVRAAQDWGTSLLVFQIVIECMILYSYNRVWMKISHDPQEYKVIKKTYYVESFINKE